MLRLYSPPIVVLLWALIMSAVGESLVLSVLAAVALGVAMTLHVEEKMHD
jgi:hypothetical protein